MCRCFPVNFVKILRTPLFTEHFRWLLLIVFKPSMGLYCPHSGMIYNPFLTNVLIFYSLKTVENQRFPLGALFRNGLNSVMKSVAPDAMVQRCSVKEVLTKISQYLQKNTCVGAKVTGCQRLQHRCFPMNIAKF